MSENQGSSGDWVREPGPSDVILVAKKGDDVEFPDYLVSALRQYEQELQSQQSSSPELELGCTINCTRLSIF